MSQTSSPALTGWQQIQCTTSWRYGALISRKQEPQLVVPQSKCVLAGFFGFFWSVCVSVCLRVSNWWRSLLWTWDHHPSSDMCSSLPLVEAHRTTIGTLRWPPPNSRGMHTTFVLYTLSSAVGLHLTWTDLTAYSDPVHLSVCFFLFEINNPTSCCLKMGRLWRVILNGFQRIQTNYCCSVSHKLTLWSLSLLKWTAVDCIHWDISVWSMGHYSAETQRNILMRKEHMITYVFFWSGISVSSSVYLEWMSLKNAWRNGSPNKVLKWMKNQEKMETWRGTVSTGYCLYPGVFVDSGRGGEAAEPHFGCLVRQEVKSRNPGLPALCFHKSLKAPVGNTMGHTLEVRNSR